MKSNRKAELRAIRRDLMLYGEVIRLAVSERIAGFRERLEQLNEELEEQFDNLSEASQDGKPGDIIQEDMSDVEYIMQELEEFEDCPDTELAMYDPDRIECNPFSSIIEMMDELLNKTAEDY